MGTVSKQVYCVQHHTPSLTRTCHPLEATAHSQHGCAPVTSRLMVGTASEVSVLSAWLPARGPFLKVHVPPSDQPRPRPWAGVNPAASPLSELPLRAGFGVQEDSAWEGVCLAMSAMGKFCPAMLAQPLPPKKAGLTPLREQEDENTTTCGRGGSQPTHGGERPKASAPLLMPSLEICDVWFPQRPVRPGGAQSNPQGGNGSDPTRCYHGPRGGP